MAISGPGRCGEHQLYWVADNVIANGFPDASSALREPDGLLAIGGTLTPECLLDAYRRGIFPWYSAGQPILWWSPNPRCVLFPDQLKVSRSLRKTLRQQRYQVTINQSFRDVIAACAQGRKGSSDTWITPEMAAAYNALYELGHALSVECWQHDELAGGLYGVVIGKVFFGESMFSRKTDASKVALYHLVQQLRLRHFRLIDCQIYSQHLQSLGATSMPRDMFVSTLRRYCDERQDYRWPCVCDPSQ